MPKTLASATFYPLDDNGGFETGEDILKDGAPDGDGANRVIRYYGQAGVWPNGGEWRLIYSYSEK